MTFNFRLFTLTAFALTAFAANSFLCRWALAGQAIDPLSFTLLRLFSGAVMLLLLYWVIERQSIKALLSLKREDQVGSLAFGPAMLDKLTALWPACLLFTYAAGFSYAYISLETGIGALILFAAVQISMISINILNGDKPNRWQWAGIFISFSGFIYLLFPSLSSPGFLGFVLMTVAGVAWGLYSLQAKSRSTDLSALAKTTKNFVWSLPFGLLLLIFVLVLNGYQGIFLQTKGIALALISGALTSGVGYAIWYQAVKQLNATLASVSQLLVPVIATAMGISFLAETLSLHFILATGLVLGGVMLVLLKKG